MSGLIMWKNSIIVSKFSKSSVLLLLTPSSCCRWSPAEKKGILRNAPAPRRYKTCWHKFVFIQKKIHCIVAAQSHKKALMVPSKCKFDADNALTSLPTCCGFECLSVPPHLQTHLICTTAAFPVTDVTAGSRAGLFWFCFLIYLL